MIVTDADLDRMFTPRRIVRPETTSNAWSERGVLRTPIADLAYWIAGEGPTVLLVHGWEGSHADLDAFVAPLVARGRRVVSFDHVAHGASAGTMATLFDFRDDVRAMIDRFGPIDAIVAHSIGSGASAMALYDGAKIGRIAMVATPLRYEDFVRAYAEATGMAVQTLFDAIAARGLDLKAMNLLAVAPAMDTPALLVHSADDRVTSARNSENVAAVWPGSKLIRVDGLGHNRILRDLATIEAIVDFVA